MFTWAETGEMLTATGGAIVTTAKPDLEGSATETAVIVTCGGVGTVLGAVYIPLVVRVPHADSAQLAPLNCQVTPVMVVPLTNAVKRCCWPTTTDVCAGD